MKQILTKITNGEVLTREQTCQIVRHIADGEYNDVQISALLTGLIMRGIKVDEVLGLRDGLIETGQPVDFSPYRVIDIVGTGGDNKNTFNISTCACFVVAGAGYKVAKHGNYAATSTSGASNVIEHHGVRFTADSNLLRRSMEACNFAYLHAPLFAHGMKAVAPVRKMLQIPTCFNLLGPLVNPCRPAYQLLGVANLNQMRLYSSVYEKLGIGYGIVNSIDGYDEPWRKSSGLPTSACRPSARKNSTAVQPRTRLRKFSTAYSKTAARKAGKTWYWPMRPLPSKSSNGTRTSPNASPSPANRWKADVP